jgi:glycosyltransferase involved in cell wall biosynthesis
MTTNVTLADREHTGPGNPTISVVVPTYNRRVSLGRLLQALEQQTYPADQFEVVVVDDGSTDGTADAVRTLKPPYVLRPLVQENRGPAAARNHGVEQARGQLILFLDDDVEPLPDLLAVHQSIQGSRPGQVVVGPMLPPPNWPRPTWIRWEEEKLERQYQAMKEGRYACSPRQFYTGNASLPRSIFLDAGGFNVEFKRAEDVELAWRLALRGARFRFEPAAQVLHYAERSFKAWSRTPYQYGQYDVRISRETGIDVLEIAFREMSRRHLLSRSLARGLADRKRTAALAIAVLGGAARLGNRFGACRGSSAALSGLFNLLYWRGVSDELGGIGDRWDAAARAPVLHGRGTPSGRGAQS